ncbi:MAG: right-handed parallel beta-helix repeat-containing protein [Clostridia bacterium]|nr:right-handed parallel beta-helix repeat-containing protein [Clostridia bacterium]
MIYHVSPNGCDRAAGTAEAPFRTINRAAAVAVAGDTVQVHEGTYREWVDPKNSGTSDHQRIIFEAAPGEHAVIKGSEIVTGWEKHEGKIWKKVLPNTMFGDWNPYALLVEGDWLVQPATHDAHLGEVYLNGVSMYEAISKEELYSDEVREFGVNSHWGFDDGKIQYPERTVYRWLAEVGEESTTLYAGFGDLDPNNELVEINVRPCCFYPKQTGRNYITLRGFEIAHGACPWTPPTSDQIGMVGPHWALGWVIENNDIHDAKCSAISIGKEASTGHNLHSRFDKKSGHRYQLEAVFAAAQMGWSKDTVGSHIIRNNVIHDCGQNGVVGHLGCVFSRIEHNHIYNIGLKREFWGHEMGGIKLHAAIDVLIKHNNIHHCTLGTWLDWQAQGTRVTQNIYHHNLRDFMVEVTHGPCTVDHNIFTARYAMDNWAQGTAFVHNLFLGTVRHKPILGRSTPYHLPHSTAVKGYCEIYSGDDRVFNNIFAGYWEETEKLAAFTANYDGFHTPEEYEQAKAEQHGVGREIRGLSQYGQIPQPVYIDGNAYGGFATPFRAEQTHFDAQGFTAEFTEQNGKWVLTVTVPEALLSANCKPVTTERLGVPRLTEESYENPDGTALDLSRDLFGNQRNGTLIPGPIATLSAGTQSFVVWEA